MDADAERARRLTERLRERPRQCPACGSSRTRRTTPLGLYPKDIGTLVVANRQCRRCGCRWAPPWDPLSAWMAVVVGLAMALLCGALAVILAGIALSPHVDRSVAALECVLVLVFGVPSCVLFGALSLKGVLVLAGRSGRARLLQPGRDGTT